MQRNLGKSFQSGTDLPIAHSNPLVGCVFELKKHHAQTECRQSFLPPISRVRPLARGTRLPQRRFSGNRWHQSCALGRMNPASLKSPGTEPPRNFHVAEYRRSVMGSPEKNTLFANRARQKVPHRTVQRLPHLCPTASAALIACTVPSPP